VGNRPKLNSNMYLAWFRVNECFGLVVKMFMALKNWELSSQTIKAPKWQERSEICGVKNRNKT